MAPAEDMWVCSVVTQTIPYFRKDGDSSNGTNSTSLSVFSSAKSNAGLAAIEL